MLYLSYICRELRKGVQTEFSSHEIKGVTYNNYISSSIYNQDAFIQLKKRKMKEFHLQISVGMENLHMDWNAWGQPSLAFGDYIFQITLIVSILSKLYLLMSMLLNDQNRTIKVRRSQKIPNSPKLRTLFPVAHSDRYRTLSSPSFPHYKQGVHVPHLP